MIVRRSVVLAGALVALAGCTASHHTAAKTPTATTTAVPSQVSSSPFVSCTDIAAAITINGTTTPLPQFAENTPVLQVPLGATISASASPACATSIVRFGFEEPNVAPADAETQASWVASKAGQATVTAAYSMCSLTPPQPSPGLECVGGLAVVGKITLNIE